MSSMRVSVTAVTVPVTTVTMSMTVLEGVYSDQVHQESQHRHHKEPLVLDLGRLYRPFHGFLEHDEEGDEEQEQAVDETREDLDSDVAVGVALVGAPFRDDRGGQSTCRGSKLFELLIDCYLLC